MQASSSSVLGSIWVSYRLHQAQKSTVMFTLPYPKTLPCTHTEISMLGNGLIREYAAWALNTATSIVSDDMSGFSQQIIGNLVGFLREDLGLDGFYRVWHGWVELGRNWRRFVSNNLRCFTWQTSYVKSDSKDRLFSCKSHGLSHIQLHKSISYMQTPDT